MKKEGRRRGNYFNKKSQWPKGHRLQTMIQICEKLNIIILAPKPYQSHE